MKKIKYPDPKEQLFLLIQKYKRSYTKKDFEKFINGPYQVSVFLKVLQQVPLNKTSRKDATKMQRLYNQTNRWSRLL